MWITVSTPEGRLPVLGLCAAAFGDTELEAALGTIRELGLDLIDLPTDSTLRLTPDLATLEQPDYAAKLREALDSFGITVGCVSNSRDTQLLLGPHGPHTDPVCPGTPEEKRAHALRYAAATINLAAAIGSPMVRLYFGCPDYARWLSWGTAAVSWDDNILTFAETAAPILAQCRAAGVTLCVEPHPKQVIYDRRSARHALDALVDYSDVLGICLDPANICALGYDPTALVRGWSPPPVAVHVKDLEIWAGADWPDIDTKGWVRYGPQPPIRFRALGRGSLPWPAMLDALLAGGFTGVVYIEHEDVLLPRAQSISTAAARLRTLLPVTWPEGRTW